MKKSEKSGINFKKIIIASLILGLLVLNVIQFIVFKNIPPQEHYITADYVTDLFHNIFYDSKNTWLKNKWLGVLTQQNPNDVWITQEIIQEVNPDFIVETGTLFGGSAVLWAMILDQVNPEGKVITVDIEDRVTKAKDVPIAKEKIEFLIGSSVDAKIIETITERVKGKKVMVILDALHTKDHVYKELQLYSPLVNVGSYLIVQDTNINGHPVYTDYGPGPMEAVRQFLSEDDSFKIDKSRERLLFTLHPDGYLKRVK